MPLNGSGTEEDPWLIQTDAEWSSVLRDQWGSGFYRATGNLTASVVALSNATAQSYLPRVIDAAGYELIITISASATVSCVVAGVQFVNAMLLITASVTGQFSQSTMFVNCYFTDCVLLLHSTAAGNKYFGSYYAAHSALLGNVFTRLLVLGQAGGVSGHLTISIGAGLVTPTHVYQRTSTAGSWYSMVSGSPSVGLLDSASSGGFTSNGWFFDSVFGVARPYFADVIDLVVSTLVNGLPAARDIMYETGGKSFVLGRTDETGVLDISLRVRRFLTFRLIASESYALDILQEGSYVSAGVCYLSSYGNGYKYQASASGQIVGLSSVSFGSTPVVMNDITYTPIPVYAESFSARTSRLTGGAQQFITLDTASGSGGGGPVLEGDPAYLDGVVEEIHPLLGAVRPLVNAEVVVFEKRTEGFAAMGSAYSNVLGEFRVETEVYGGGDIFAFAADFPGLVWQPAMELGLGAKVRPTVNNGYVYEIVTAGVAGGAEPAWWADEGDGTEGAIGSATAKARPYYQPVGHGPLKMTLVE